MVYRSKEFALKERRLRELIDACFVELVSLSLRFIFMQECAKFSYINDSSLIHENHHIRVVIS